MLGTSRVSGTCAPVSPVLKYSHGPAGRESRILCLTSTQTTRHEAGVKWHKVLQPTSYSPKCSCVISLRQQASSSSSPRLPLCTLQQTDSHYQSQIFSPVEPTVTEKLQLTFWVVIDMIYIDILKDWMLTVDFQWWGWHCWTRVRTVRYASELQC